jgi:hypothetical protein
VKRQTALFGKTYVWVRATRTGQWRLARIPERTGGQPWSDPEHDVLADLREAVES